MLCVSPKQGVEGLQGESKGTKRREQQGTRREQRQERKKKNDPVFIEQAAVVCVPGVVQHAEIFFFLRERGSDLIFLSRARTFLIPTFFLTTQGCSLQHVVCVRGLAAISIVLIFLLANDAPRVQVWVS
jgi:hypothetical protein